MTQAPELAISQWFNTDAPLTLAQLRGRVVVLHAFQMLCPGCVQGGIPQAQRIANLFSPDKVAVIGLHTVFEHHDAMTPVALKAFLHEYRITFPVGVDVPGECTPIPQTMAAYGMQGTPTLILIDRAGRIRKHGFGAEDDLRVGADIALLTAEPASA
ncbi:redoxin family protein [Afipia carboxidovorans]|uniref:redoxin family protein n=1 Tax=Afipia carboxidovorans TaxID=40137 RepID=UPI00308685CB|nr:redoxin domain-containing protein [Afipia carboxidovorans]